jgi:hypothetical protein
VDERERVSIEDLPPGTVRVLILHSYEAQLDDELTLAMGRQIFMVRSFDDGWGLGVDPITGKQGAFPLVCADVSSIGGASQSNLDHEIRMKDRENAQLDRNLNAGIHRESTLLEPPRLQQEELLRGPETKKIARRLSSMIVKDLARGGTRSKMPLSEYMQQMGSESAFHVDLQPVQLDPADHPPPVHQEFIDPPTPEHELIRGPDTKKVGRRLSSVIVKDLAKSGTRSKMPLSEYLQQTGSSSLHPDFKPVDSSLDEKEINSRPTSRLVNDITKDIQVATSPVSPQEPPKVKQEFMEPIIPTSPEEELLHVSENGKTGRRLSSIIAKDLAKSGTRSKVPFSTYIKELEGIDNGNNRNSVVDLPISEVGTTTSAFSLESVPGPTALLNHLNSPDTEKTERELDLDFGPGLDFGKDLGVPRKET